ncbi:MAG: hypothetical protein HY231_23800 [Acidobacteria bacterium]|nr:hypothetical protein [Acidobacteriota bacterium]
MEFTVKASGALNMRPSAFNHLVGKNISTAENDTMRPAREIVKKPIPDGASGILKATKFERATIANLAFSISNKHPLIEYVEEKTKPHVIQAKNKKSLAFKGKGGMVFAKKVNHPGTKGKHSFLHAWEFVQAVFQPSCQQAVDAAFEGRAYNGGAVSRASPTVIKI